MKKRYAFVPALVTAALTLLIFASYNLFPFAHQTLAWCDMKQQVIPLLIDFKHILSGDTSMFLNLQNAGGMSFVGVFFFFLASPFSFLVSFVDEAGVYMLANLLVLLKMAACAFTAGLFFACCYKKLSLMQNTALSVMYAFCGYTMMYFQNVVWLDMMYVFPLVLLGLWLLVKKGKIALFVLSFSASFVVQFYLSYMLTVFLILAFGIFAACVLEPEQKRRSIVLLALSVFISMFLTAAVWLPSLMQYLNSARTTDILTNLSSGSIQTSWATTMGVIVCTGVLVSSLLAVLFIREFRDKKILSIVLIIIMMIIPLFVEPINKMWHTGSYQAFPARYGFITVFCALILTAELISFLNTEEKKIERPKSFSILFSLLSVAMLAALALLAGLLLSGEWESLTIYVRKLWLNNAFLDAYLPFTAACAMVYFLFFMLYRFGFLKKQLFSMLLCLVVLIESGFSGSVFLGSASNDVTYLESVLDLSGKIEDDSLFRVKTEKKTFDVNLVGALGYGSLSHYTSLTAGDYLYTLRRLGYSTYWMEASSVGGTAFSDLLYSLNYTILPSGEAGETIYENSNLSLVKNQFTAPIGFVMKDAASWTLPEGNRFEIQNFVFSKLFSEEKSLFTEYEPIKTENLSINGNYLTRYNDAYNGVLYYTVHVTGKQILYFDCFDTVETTKLKEAVNGACIVRVNGIELESDYPSQKGNGILKLGEFEDETVRVEIRLKKNVDACSFGVYGMDKELLSESCAALQSADLSQVKNRLEGTVTAQEDGEYLFLSIPNIDGYTIKINGEKRDILCVFDDFMAVRLDAGENTVELSYVPKGMIPGAVLTFLGIGFFVLALYLLKKKQLLDRLLKVRKPIEVVYWVLFVGTFVLIYVFPLVVFISGQI